MSWEDLLRAREILGVGADELGHQLGVDRRTVHRWKYRGVSGPAAAAIRSFLRLHEHGIPWRPGAALEKHYVPTVWLADEKRPAKATGDWSDVWARNPR